MIKTTTDKQRTIGKTVSLTGVGLHTGANVTLRFLPAGENHGYAFKRVDLEGQPIIEADSNYVINTQRGTNLEKRGVKIQTSEHVLAALVGLEIDNVSQTLQLEFNTTLETGTSFFDPPNDNFAFYDSNANIVKKMFIDDLAIQLAGENLSANNGRLEWGGTSAVNLALYNSSSDLLTQAPPTSSVNLNSLAGVSHASFANGSSLVYCDGVSWFYVNLGDYIN